MVIDSTLEPGDLTYAELAIEGAGAGEVLISTYVCHPSLANDNLSGIAVATMLAKRLLERDLRHTYRFVFGPGTIGPLAWLHQNSDRLDRVQHGLTLSCIGDAGDFTYKRSRRGDAEVDRAMEIVLRDSGRTTPGAPVGAVGRRRASVLLAGLRPTGGLADAHTARRVRRLPHLRRRARPDPAGVPRGSGDYTLELVDVLETNCHPTNLSPYGEPQLGRRGLYRSAGGAVETPDDERALLWVLNLSDGDGKPAGHRAAVRSFLFGHPPRGGAARPRRPARLSDYPAAVFMSAWISAVLSGRL